MNVAVRTASPEIASQPADPLDHLAGNEPGTAGEIRLSEKLPQFAWLCVRSAWDGARNQFRGQPFRCRWRLDYVALPGRSRALAGGLLSGLSDRGCQRPATVKRLALRRRGRLLPSRAVPPSRSAAVLPDARICLHRQPQ